MFILVITDGFTKLVKAVPMKGIPAREVSEIVEKHWGFNYGPPTELLSDNGSQFTSKFVQEICHILNTKN